MKTVRAWMRRHNDGLIVAFFVTLSLFSICNIWLETESAIFAVRQMSWMHGFEFMPDRITLAQKLFYTVPIFVLMVFVAVDFEKLGHWLRRKRAAVQ